MISNSGFNRMRAVVTAVFVSTAATVSLPHSARAAEADLGQRVEQLERRLEEIEEDEASPDSSPSSFWSDGIGRWAERIRISGNGDFQYLYGENNSKVPEGRFAVENTRFFIEADLGGQVELWDQPLVGGSSFYFEWDLVRAADLKNDVGSLYLRLDRLLDQRALNLKFGRMPLPFGEEYLRFHEQRPDNPLLSFSVASPYGLDEGIMLFGSVYDGLFQYMAAVTNGDYDAFQNSESEPAITAKIIVEPTSWLHVSASAHRSGELGPTDDHSFGFSALKIGEFGAYPFVVPSAAIPTFQDGELVPPESSRKVDNVVVFEGDVILKDSRYGRLWLSYGHMHFESASSDSYDRDLHYWVAEGILELGALTEVLNPFYAAVRYSGIGTYDNDEGWRLRVMNGGANLGYNVEKVTALSGGVGFRLNEHIVIKAEYSHFDFDLVRGVTSELRSLAKSRDYYGIGTSVSF